jgi:dTDP-glucose pyrophosphorylase
MPKRINLIPMAGAGQRFADVGYTLPKPLIPVAGQPMIVRAAGCLPKPDEWIFVCRQEHIAQAQIDRELKKLFTPAEIISVDRLTEGQACTCLLAKDKLDPNAILTIGACDNAMNYDLAKFEAAIYAPDCDALIWTFRNNPAVLQDPRMYGWVDADAAGRVRRVSVKVPISDKPMNDHAVIGAFTFKRAGDFVNAAEAMIRANRRIKNEFYVDEAMNLAVEQGLRVKVFEVEHYICWGTPRDLDTYNYWRGWFADTGL